MEIPKWLKSKPDLYLERDNLIEELEWDAGDIITLVRAYQAPNLYAFTISNINNFPAIWRNNENSNRTV